MLARATHRLALPLSRIAAVEPWRVPIPGPGLSLRLTDGDRWPTTFALWWAAWIIGVALCATALRAAIEAGTLLGVVMAPARAMDARRALERLGSAELYLGLPASQLMRMLGA